MITMFKISITEGWLEIMWSGIDARGIEKTGRRDHSPFRALFFVIFVLFGSWFMLNIFDNITIDNFIKEKDKSTGFEMCN